MEEKHIKYLKNLLGNRVLTGSEIEARYASDHTEDFVFYPAIVVKPETTKEVSSIMHYCYKNDLTVTPSGARTGLSGGALANHGGVLLSMERMNKIVQIDEENHQVITEPGVITEELQNAVKAVGLFYPPDPASKGSCFIGGNIAENSGGPKAVKYGVTKDWVLNLEIVLPNGEILWTGANVIKNATGYNLTQLIIGSEGTLAVVTKIVLRLIPHPTHNVLLLVPFRNGVEACEAVGKIFMAGIIPSGLEYMDRDAIIFTAPYVDDAPDLLKSDHDAHLLIELDGFDLDVLMQESEKIMELAEQFDIDEILFAETEAQKESLWRLRRKIGECVKTHSTYKEEDTVVPRYELPQLLKKVKELEKKYGFKSVCYGHAGDGNLHVNIIRDQLSEDTWTYQLPEAIRELFTEVVRLGGTISGEHGIGLVQTPYMDLAFNETGLDLMRAIKHVFDPKNLLNPGKILPEKSGTT
ncbi:FAD-linked oxidase C-terminal domain-containing protein [Fluviicola sp.]|jgi:glycolate oxidase|uniref:FAD-binding oxidoreductase n=1 Tax=Fluviicola sp. TaxID=1917219 RepID=UPI00282C02C8|nr:FAD-linked oxidase C-terminal domain-containing protein [Fluviicola sp.]MDR0802458.1 FAD-binding protein [Fluviicola sp.]